MAVVYDWALNVNGKTFQLTNWPSCRKKALFTKHSPYFWVISQMNLRIVIRDQTDSQFQKVKNSLFYLS